MTLYPDSGPKSEKDTYYQEQSAKAIESAVEASKGKTLEEVRFAIRRSYPFGPLRKGRPYKVWSRLVHEMETKLGMEPRRHKKYEQS